jgi:hypothetical protein
MMNEKPNEESKQVIEKLLSDSEAPDHTNTIKKDLEDIARMKREALEKPLSLDRLVDEDDIIQAAQRRKKKQLVAQPVSIGVVDTAVSNTVQLGLSFNELRIKYADLSNNLLKFSLLGEAERRAKKREEEREQLRRREEEQAKHKEELEAKQKSPVEEQVVEIQHTNAKQLEQESSSDSDVSVHSAVVQTLEEERHDQQIQTSAQNSPQLPSTTSPFSLMLSQSKRDLGTPQSPHSPIRQVFYTQESDVVLEQPKKKRDKKRVVKEVPRERTPSPEPTRVQPPVDEPKPQSPVRKQSPERKKQAQEQLLYEQIRMKRGDGTSMSGLQVKIDATREKEIQKQKRQEEIEAHLQREREERERERALDIQIIVDEEDRQVNSLFYTNTRLPKPEPPLEDDSKRVRLLEGDPEATFTDGQGINTKDSEEFLSQLADKYTEKCIKYISQHVLSAYLNELVTSQRSLALEEIIADLKPQFAQLKGGLLSAQVVQFCMDNGISLHDPGLEQMIQDVIIEAIIRALRNLEPERDDDLDRGILSLLYEVPSLNDDLIRNQNDLTRDVVLKLVIHDILMQREEERKVKKEITRVEPPPTPVIISNEPIPAPPEPTIETNERATSPIPIETVSVATIATSPPPSPEKAPPTPHFDAQLQVDLIEPPPIKPELSSSNTQTEPPKTPKITVGLPHFFLLSDVHHDRSLPETRSLSGVTHVPTRRAPSPEKIIQREIQTQTLSLMNEDVEIQTMPAASEEVQIQTKEAETITSAIQTGQSLHFVSIPKAPSPLKIPTPKAKSESPPSPEEEPIPVSKHLFPYLQESEIEQKLRFEVAQGKRPSYLYYSLSDSCDSASTLSSQETYSTQSEKPNIRDQMEFAHDLLREANYALIYDSVESDFSVSVVSTDSTVGESQSLFGSSTSSDVSIYDHYD